MNKNFSMIKGDTLAFAVKITYDTTPQSLDSAYFTCKKNYSDEKAVFQKKLDNGIYVSDTTEDAVYYTVRVAPIDTQNVEAGLYYYDMQISVNGDVFTILNGVLDIGYEVTTGEADTELFQEKTVVPSTSQQTVTADSGYVALSEVTVTAVPNGNNEAY